MTVSSYLPCVPFVSALLFVSFIAILDCDSVFIIVISVCCIVLSTDHCLQWIFF
jgi:hypothetical protein